MSGETPIPGEVRISHVIGEKTAINPKSGEQKGSIRKGLEVLFKKNREEPIPPKKIFEELTKLGTYAKLEELSKTTSDIWKNGKDLRHDGKPFYMQQGGIDINIGLIEEARAAVQSNVIEKRPPTSLVKPPAQLQELIGLLEPGKPGQLDPINHLQLSKYYYSLITANGIRIELIFPDKNYEDSHVKVNYGYSDRTKPVPADVDGIIRSKFNLITGLMDFSDAVLNYTGNVLAELPKVHNLIREKEAKKIQPINTEVDMSRKPTNITSKQWIHMCKNELPGEQYLRDNPNNLPDISLNPNNGIEGIVSPDELPDEIDDNIYLVITNASQDKQGKVVGFCHPNLTGNEDTNDVNPDGSSNDGDSTYNIKEIYKDAEAKVKARKLDAQGYRALLVRMDEAPQEWDGLKDHFEILTGGLSELDYEGHMCDVIEWQRTGIRPEPEE